MFRLREIDIEDVKIINKWRNDPELISHFGSPFRYINMEVDVQWFNAYMQSRKNTVRCSIVDEEIVVGLVTLANIDQSNQCCELCIMIGEKQNRGKGAGSFAVKEMINHAFYHLNLHRIELAVLETNTAAIHLYEKCGFKLEGIKKQSRYKDGKFVDVRYYGLLREEYCC